MRSSTLLLSFGLIATACPAETDVTQDPLNPSTPKALVVGVDGLRGDALQAADTPRLDAELGHASWTLEATTQQRAPTVSGPGWTSVVTGVDADKHRIVENGGYGDRDWGYPSFLQRAKDAGLSAVGSIHWFPLLTEILEDDLFAEQHFGTDDYVTETMATMLQRSDADLFFVHLDDVDGSGHDSGFAPDNPAYLQTIATKDAQIGVLLDAIESRPGRADERWLVVITSDHGGLGTDHGGDSEQERHVPLLLLGDAASGEALQSASHLDVAPTVLHHVGVPVQDGWGLDGRVVGLATP